MSELHGTYDGWRSSGGVTDAEVLGDCDNSLCNADLFEIAYEWGGTVICPSCAKRNAIVALQNTPSDDLDGFPAIERATVCRDCGRYACVCP